MHELRYTSAVRYLARIRAREDAARPKEQGGGAFHERAKARILAARRGH